MSDVVEIKAFQELKAQNEKLNLQVKGLVNQSKALRQAINDLTDQNILLRTNLNLFQESHSEIQTQLSQRDKMLEVANNMNLQLNKEVDELKLKQSTEKCAPEA